MHGPLSLVAGATSCHTVVGMVISALTFRQDVVNRQVFCGATVDTFMSIPSLNAFPPHPFSVTASEAEEIRHEASGSIHWLIGLGLVGGINRKLESNYLRLSVLIKHLDPVGRLISTGNGGHSEPTTGEG